LQLINNFKVRYEHKIGFICRYCVKSQPANSPLDTVFYLFQNFSALTKKGYLGQPRSGNKELGKILFNTAVKKVADLFLDFNKQIDNH